MAKKSKEMVLVNVLWDEEGIEYFRLEKSDSSGNSLQDVPDVCYSDGVWINSEDLDKFLEFNEERIEVIKDWRDKEDYDTQGD